jgi:hypothetical protein
VYIQLEYFYSAKDKGRNFGRGYNQFTFANKHIINFVLNDLYKEYIIENINITTLAYILYKENIKIPKHIEIYIKSPLSFLSMKKYISKLIFCDERINLDEFEIPSNHIQFFKILGKEIIDVKPNLLKAENQFDNIHSLLCHYQSIVLEISYFLLMQMLLDHYVVLTHDSIYGLKEKISNKTIDKINQMLPYFMEGAFPYFRFNEKPLKTEIETNIIKSKGQLFSKKLEKKEKLEEKEKLIKLQNLEVQLYTRGKTRRFKKYTRVYSKLTT